MVSKVKFFLVCGLILSISYFSFAQEVLNKFGISMQGPEGWVLQTAAVEDLPSTGLATVAIFREGTAKNYMTVLAGRIGKPNYTLQNFTTEHVSKMQAIADANPGKINFTSEPQQSITINGLEGIKVVQNLDESGVKNKGIGYYFMRGNLAVTVTTNTNFDGFATYAPIFEKAISTFKIE